MHILQKVLYEEYNILAKLDLALHDAFGLNQPKLNIIK